jgi:hypothetical protein
MARTDRFPTFPVVHCTTRNAISGPLSINQSQSSRRSPKTGAVDGLSIR